MMLHILNQKLCFQLMPKAHSPHSLCHYLLAGIDMLHQHQSVLQNRTLRAVLNCWKVLD